MPASRFVSQTVNSIRIGSADKKALFALLTDLVNDIETLRANQRALALKLDADVGVTDTNYAALASTPAGGLTVGK